MWADGYNAIAPHVSQKANFVLVAKVEIGKLRDWARHRGWDKIRLSSSGQSTFNADFQVEDDRSQHPGVSVFSREPEGKIHHFYTTEVSLHPAPNGNPNHRGIDSIHRSGISSTSCPKDARIRRLNFLLIGSRRACSRGPCEFRSLGGETVFGTALGIHGGPLKKILVATQSGSQPSESSCFPGHFSFIDVLYGTDARIVSGAK
jgi:hypothetical protein